jgi:hypothetical protein
MTPFSFSKLLVVCGVGLVASACSSRSGIDVLPEDLVPPECTHSCSADGHAVVDCNGNVVQQCEAYGTCFDAACIAACEAAVKSESSVGCEYYVAKPSAYTYYPVGLDASCYAVLIANSWDAPVSISVEYDGTEVSSSYFRIPRGQGDNIRYELLPEGKLPRGEMAILFLAVQPDPNQQFTDYIACPEGVGAAIVGQTEVHGSGFGKAFHIRASAPVVAYDIFPYGGARSHVSSTTLLLPTSAWGRENVAMDGYSVGPSQANQGFSPYFQIVAAEDDTHVRIRPTTTLPSVGGAPEMQEGQIGELSLRRGEFVQFAQFQEMNGTGVESDKPVAVSGGTTCVNIPDGVGACDMIHQQIPPIRLLGDTYVATRYRDRVEGSVEVTPWRIAAVVDGTTLTFDPPIDGAPTTLGRGEWAEFWAPGPFVVRSQDASHPIYVAAYMTGGGNVSTRQGDPEFVNVVPVGQYLRSYIFLTDPTYGNTNLVFVRAPVDGRYEDVELDCAGRLSGWTRVGKSAYEVTYVDLVRDGVAMNGCHNGVHQAWSKNPFALTVWGWDQWVSYGFPAGTGTKPLNDVPAVR